MVEKVEKMTTTHSITPAVSARDGHRYARQRRRRKTSVPTIVSASRISPRRRKSEAKSQCEISALGTTLASLEILHQPGRDQECEERADEHDEQGRLREEVVEALTVRVQERDAVGLSHRPHQPGEDRERPEQLHGEDPARALSASR